MIVDIHQIMILVIVLEDLPILTNWSVGSWFKIITRCTWRTHYFRHMFEDLMDKVTIGVLAEVFIVALKIINGYQSGEELR